jgi:hypothetical protein
MPNMKKIFYILLLITGIMDAQIVYIPDANFKAKLLSASPTVYVGSTVNPDSSATPNVYTTIDVNGNGEIEVSEAQNIIYLKLNWVSGFGAKISNLQGIEAFTNLKTLYCAYNSLSTLDLTSNINLDYVGCWNNLLASVNVSSCINLKTLSCSYNNLSSVDLSGNPNLSDLIIGNNQLTSLNVDVNQYLSNITANSNNLTSINVFNKNLLTTLNVGYNQITNINLVNLPHLYKVNVQNNLITALDLSTVAFQTYFNNISNPSMYEISLNNNLDLIYINLKNGFTNSNISLSSLNVNNQIQYICKDNNDVFSSANYNSNSLVSSYCNFTPGGYYNTITGSIQFDADNNGCDASDLPQPNIKININDGTASGATFTNNQGNYNFYTQAGSFVLTPDIENPTWFTFSLTTATIPFADNNSNTTTQNFCIAANGVHNDVEVVVEPIMFARPGFDATYKIVYKNKGNQTLSGDVSLSYDDSVLDFISATVAPNSQSTGVMNWNYTGLLPFENRSFYVTFNVNAPTATPPVNIGDVLSFNASITPVITDENPLDNSFAYNQTVVGSFDPNDITCLEGETVPPSSIGSYLHYGVNFENTGTYPAENIVVKVVIDTAKYDVNSLQLLNTSNPAYTKITGNVVEFIFKNIMLDTGGHGNVLFKIKSNPTLVVGDAVTNRADIFFDYNFPIDTGMANTVFQALSNTDFEIDNFVFVAPNPASTEVTIKANHSIKSIQLYDAQGRVILIRLVDASELKLDVSSYSKGIYFIKITTDKGIKVQKLQKD